MKNYRELAESLLFESIFTNILFKLSEMGFKYTLVANNSSDLSYKIITGRNNNFELILAEKSDNSVSILLIKGSVVLELTPVKEKDVASLIDDISYYSKIMVVKSKISGNKIKLGGLLGVKLKSSKFTR